VLPASPLRCKNKRTCSSEAATTVVAAEDREGGEKMGEDEDKEGSASVETPSGSLPVASDDEDSGTLEHGR